MIVYHSELGLGLGLGSYLAKLVALVSSLMTATDEDTTCLSVNKTHCGNYNGKWRGEGGGGGKEAENTHKNNHKRIANRPSELM